ncbi:hypothetical protein FT663_01421 [Candidozyma haemuli var. vulneris]|uniref:RING-type domain-containing protein n=1 Tax=Candidozyma haemuli TaxID=45357 RepID=A0A2V1AYU7_9ASCO|nr:hypothetical protein CXQ85_002737 [[Candida] haemuloni]KAF3992556.1 hypothetical protein FT662_01102 [[Candida] haemuloni var. vulneris]KAF3994508.1 hypothetical protein FT663_01421 [[Candida] haemuloni var. vulneris]PVH23012.1 hypothetical protein CXQ85_002737 [[Candida] haemuloni]
MSFVINISSEEEEDDEVQVLEFRKHTQDLINEAPPKVVKKLNEAECPICFDTVTNATTTFCGHVYCLECLQQSISASSAQGQTRGKRGVGLCPMCRKSTTFKDALVLRLRTGRKVEPPKDDEEENEDDNEEKVVIDSSSLTRGLKRKHSDDHEVHEGSDDLDELFGEKT